LGQIWDYFFRPLHQPRHRLMNSLFLRMRITPGHANDGSQTSSANSIKTESSIGVPYFP
jgi:hypothetical protein